MHGGSKHKLKANKKPNQQYIFEGKDKRQAKVAIQHYIFIYILSPGWYLVSEKDGRTEDWPFGGAEEGLVF